MNFRGLLSKCPDNILTLDVIETLSLQCTKFDTFTYIDTVLDVINLIHSTGKGKILLPRRG